MPAPKWFSSTSTRPRSTPVDPGPALERASEQLSDEPADIGAHTWAGATDPEVAPETLRGVLQREPRVDDLGRLYARCLHYLAEDLWESSGYRALPSAEAPLVALGDAGATLGLVSGAMEGAPRTKLMAANLNRSFTFGAHGSDSPERSEPTRLAIERATRLHELGRAGDIDVVGATPLDMKAAHAAGATAVGAAAGRFSTDDLNSIGRAFVLRSLEGNISRAPARRWQRGLRVVSACGRTRRSGCTRACPGAPRAVQRRSCRHTAHT